MGCYSVSVPDADSVADARALLAQGRANGSSLCGFVLVGVGGCRRLGKLPGIVHGAHLLVHLGRAGCQDGVPSPGHNLHVA